MESLQSIKQRFEIIGNDPKLNRALEKCIGVAPTDISVLITGESGVGKEILPKIIHTLSHRKHAKYIAVNCGAIPEGTIDSELFGHEKGAFTGATQARKGYFQEADGGTIFLDEVGELPLTTQVRLLRVLENGEYIRVGSSDVNKTDVRIVAATNINMKKAIEKEKFREDLYYRLSTIEISLPPLRERTDDIHLLFRKFASDFAHKYNMPTLRLSEDAQQKIKACRWPGNIRQLKNVAEQLSVLEKDRLVTADKIKDYLPGTSSNLPSVIEKAKNQSDFSNEREILYKILFDMRNDINDLKKLTMELMREGNSNDVHQKNKNLISKIYNDENEAIEDFKSEHQDDGHRSSIVSNRTEKPEPAPKKDKFDFAEEVEEEEPLSIQDKEYELIKKSLERHEGRRKPAAQELGISERTLYRKIKQYGL
ncbi:MAG: sigma-54 dependent transcriptional regulator [Psychroflexus sp.]|jgi:transcriptional regulator with PAS, ATPase and Fis domain|nr:sigma-54 dependent transcriptional regulator [Psychroflexus sp.]MDR9448492.1 sigma-54 dependent transcriptional regulator [Psychroflexus sp.]